MGRLRQTTEEIQYILDGAVDVRNKANKDGSYPTLRAGNLIGHGEPIPAEFTFRATGGKSILDGVAIVTELQGNAEVINGQLTPFRGDAIKSVGDNAWDEQWEEGIVDNGENYYLPGYIRSKDYIRVLPEEQYYYTNAENNGEHYIRIAYYDEDKNYLDTKSQGIGKFTIPADAYYMRFYVNDSYGGTYKGDIIITLVHTGWKVDTNAGYQPYWSDTMFFDSRIKEYFPDGMMPWDKVYNEDDKGCIEIGSEVRSYKSGDANGDSMATDGRYTTVVKLETPTIHRFDKPFKMEYMVADFGTEELISNEPTAPFKARVIYQFNAVDLIRENYNEIQKLKELLRSHGWL